MTAKPRKPLLVNLTWAFGLAVVLAHESAPVRVVLMDQRVG